MQDIYKCFPYKSTNYSKYFIALDVIKKINSYAKNHPVIEKIYAKGSIIYGTMIPGSDIDHLRIQVKKPLSLEEKIKLVSDLEDSLKDFDISKIQRIKEDNYVRVFYDFKELVSYPNALTIKDEIYPNPHILKAKNKKRFIRKVYKRGYKYASKIDNNWINKCKRRFNLL